MASIAARAAAASLLLSCSLSACASSRQYIHLAEGLSSPATAERIEVARRMFSAPALEETCRRLSRVDRLGVEPMRIELARGSTYALASLIVVATSGAGDLVPRVPILLEAEEITPGVLQFRSDDPDVDAARLRVIGTGRFRVRVRTACGGRPAEAVIAAESR